jgi:GST-like protein
MNEPQDYTPPKIWVWDKENGGKFASVNRPVAGATHDKALPVGKHPLQLYSLATPNGQKVTILVEVNPNSKSPALMDRSGANPVRVFESGAILLYLAEKFGAFLPSTPEGRAECLSWLFWQMGSAPYLGGGFGHFYNYAPTKIEYAIDRFAMETKRQLDVLDRRLAESEYLAGADFTIADIAVFPWYGGLAQSAIYGNAGEFLSVQDYKHLQRWTDIIAKRPAVLRGRMVNRISGDPARQLWERHDAGDFETKTQDKIGDKIGEKAKA